MLFARFDWFLNLGISSAIHLPAASGEHYGAWVCEESKKEDREGGEGWEEGGRVTWECLTNLVQQTAERPDVWIEVVAIFVNPLRRHVIRRPKWKCRLRMSIWATVTIWHPAPHLETNNNVVSWLILQRVEKVASTHYTRAARKLRTEPFHSKGWSTSNFPCSLTRNIRPHSMENLAGHSLLRWKMVILPILTGRTYILWISIVETLDRT